MTAGAALIAVRRYASRDAGSAASIAALYCPWHAALFSRARLSSASWLLRAWAACPFQACNASSNDEDFGGRNLSGRRSLAGHKAAKMIGGF